MVAIIDYDAGNIKSVEKAFDYLGAKTLVTRDPKEIYRADHVVLPGVGAFGRACLALTLLIHNLPNRIALHHPRTVTGGMFYLQNHSNILLLYKFPHFHQGHII